LVSLGGNMIKKIVAFTLFIALFSVANFAQTGRGTRPRIVVIPTNPTPSPTPQTQTTAVAELDTAQENTQTDPNRKAPVLIGDNSAKNSTAKTPPVLIGGSNTPTPTPTPPATDDGTVIEDDEVIQIKTDLVTLPVSVIDRNGRFISGLQQSEFQIFEDGQQQQIEYFANVESPFTVVLLIDVSPSTSFKIEEIQNSAINFTNRLRANDKLMVVSFDRDVHVLCEPTNNRNVMKNAIMQANFGDGTGLYDAVDFSIGKLNKIEGRKAIVVFTDGVDTQSRRANYKSSVHNAEESETSIYAIRYDTYNDNKARNGGNSSGKSSGGGLLGAIIGAIVTGNIQGGGGNNGTSKADYDKGRMYLEDLAEATGGKSLLAGSLTNLESSFANIADELRQQYSVGYYPAVEGTQGQRKQVKVRVARPDLVVRSRTSYIVGDTTKPKTPK
jgi:Ca-activated chloride channel homolog